jgi:exopolyphosphatase/guanosine-5'-triphosphate,3'-diphosphate pyrophosphatase
MSISSRGLLATDCEVAAARWVQRRLGDCSHERRVLAVAAKLFDLTRPALGLGMAENRLLRLGALTHDIGRSISEKDHPEEGAKLIASTTALELSPLDRRALAYMARYHRGSVAAAFHEEYLRPLDPRPALRRVLALLRVADALDSRQIESPQMLFAIDGSRLSIQCLVSGDTRRAREVYRRRKKFHLLEWFLGTEIDVHVRRAGSFQMAN